MPPLIALPGHHAPCNSIASLPRLLCHYGVPLCLPYCGCAQPALLAWVLSACLPLMQELYMEIEKQRQACEKIVASKDKLITGRQL